MGDPWGVILPHGVWIRMNGGFKAISIFVRGSFCGICGDTEELVVVIATRVMPLKLDPISSASDPHIYISTSQIHFTGYAKNTRLDEAFDLVEKMSKRDLCS
ncbi:unnamed protein product [Dovyalis caffra]|uniref:Uncharacterized protein n=1 Tax=Dovyalis caffra TaxID=77055 RepID=A0AAV1RZG9_9ROSI|nr:unnamed protein product [Dovyalis caffra]